MFVICGEGCGVCDLWYVVVICGVGGVWFKCAVKVQVAGKLWGCEGDCSGDDE
jgi:hypothetical protein